MANSRAELTAQERQDFDDEVNAFLNKINGSDVFENFGEPTGENLEARMAHLASLQKTFFNFISSPQWNAEDDELYGRAVAVSDIIKSLKQTLSDEKAQYMIAAESNTQKEEQVQKTQSQQRSEQRAAPPPPPPPREPQKEEPSSEVEQVATVKETLVQRRQREMREQQEAKRAVSQSDRPKNTTRGKLNIPAGLNSMIGAGPAKVKASPKPPPPPPPPPRRNTTTTTASSTTASNQQNDVPEPRAAMMEMLKKRNQNKSGLNPPPGAEAALTTNSAPVMSAQDKARQMLEQSRAALEAAQNEEAPELTADQRQEKARRMAEMSRAKMSEGGINQTPSSRPPPPPPRTVNTERGVPSVKAGGLLAEMQAKQQEKLNKATQQEQKTPVYRRVETSKATPKAVPPVFAAAQQRQQRLAAGGTKQVTTRDEKPQEKKQESQFEKLMRERREAQAAAMKEQLAQGRSDAGNPSHDDENTPPNNTQNR